MTKSIKVKNLRGELEPFSAKKVYQSARNAGADSAVAKKITEKIKENIYPNIRTEKIFKEIRVLLKGKDYQTYLKFNLKRAIKKLGPTGFPFEKYIQSILKAKGFETDINIHIEGKCCTYEIDFLAKKGETVYVGECKFQNLFKGSVDINDSLINYARFLDIKDSKLLSNFSRIKSLLVTNGRFTSKAIIYSSCMGADLLGWKYPKNKGLEKIIERNNLYPITILPSLTRRMSDTFILEKKILATDVLTLDLNKFSNKFNIPINQLRNLKKEAEFLFEEKQ